MVTDDSNAWFVCAICAPTISPARNIRIRNEVNLRIDNVTDFIKSCVALLISPIFAIN